VQSEATSSVSLAAIDTWLQACQFASSNDNPQGERYPVWAVTRHDRFDSDFDFANPYLKPVYDALKKACQEARQADGDSGAKFTLTAVAVG